MSMTKGSCSHCELERLERLVADVFVLRDHDRADLHVLLVGGVA